MKKLIHFALLGLLLTLTSCDAIKNLFGTSSPDTTEITATFATPGDIKRDCPEKNSGLDISAHRAPASSTKYNITSQSERAELIEQIIDAGPERMGTTKMRMPDGSVYEVMNDSVTLPDGTYVPLTFPEAKRIAAAWDYQIPNAEQAIAIGKYAANNGNQYKAITRTPNNSQADQFKSMNEMMNDPRMKERSRAGRNKLIDGHFKWYTNTGKIYGFARGDGRFWQNRPSGAHVGDPQYYDYSHGVRLIRKVR
jgi:hypothetical protein